MSIMRRNREQPTQAKQAKRPKQATQAARGHAVPQRRVAAWPKWAGAGAAAAILSCVALVGRSRDGAAPAGTAVELPAGYDVLEQDLLALRRTLLATDRERVLAAIATRRQVLEPAMLWVLQQPKHPLFPETAALAADLELASAAEPLAAAALQGGGVRRGVAVRALDALQPLGDGDLEPLLQDADRNVVLSALRTARDRPDPPFEPMLELLRHPDDGIRTAAFDALPPALDLAAMPTLLSLRSDAVAGRAALLLLPRLPERPEVVRLLADELQGADPELQVDLLRCLGPLAAAEPMRPVLWRLVEATDSPAVQAGALYSLERVRDVRDLPAGIEQMAPRVRYHAARLLLATGRDGGLALLLDLAGREGAEAEEKAYAGHARMILSRLAQLPPHADLPQLAAWCERAGPLPPQTLPAAP